MSVVINTLQAYRRLQEGGFTDEQAEAIVDVFRMIDPHLYRQFRKRADGARAEGCVPKIV